MAFTRTIPKASPTSFEPPRQVTFSFKATNVDGSGDLKVVYSASTLTLDGQQSITRHHQIGVNTPIADTFVVAGAPGERAVRITCSDNELTLANTVKLDLQS